MLLQDIIGIIPAAGRGSRIAPLPVSKEIFPVGFQEISGSPRPKVVGHYLLEQMANAKIKRCFIILGDNKWDIPAYFANGKEFGIDIAYSVIRQSPGTPFTLDTIYSFIADRVVALGFPDILFGNKDVYSRLLKAFDSRQCDVLLGLFPAAQTHLCDMVALDQSGRVDHISIKPAHTNLTRTWGVAVWKPTFSQFMHNWLANVDLSNLNHLGARHGHSELFVGDVIQAAIEAGLQVEAVDVSEQAFLDIGTPHNLQRAIHENNPTQ